MTRLDLEVEIVISVHFAQLRWAQGKGQIFRAHNQQHPHPLQAMLDESHAPPLSTKTLGLSWPH